MKYSVEISLVMDGQYVPDSDLHIGIYDSYEKAQEVAEEIDAQSPELYECYIYTLNDDDEILETSRIW